MWNPEFVRLSYPSLIYPRILRLFEPTSNCSRSMWRARIGTKTFLRRSVSTRSALLDPGHCVQNRFKLRGCSWRHHYRERYSNSVRSRVAGSGRALLPDEHAGVSSRIEASTACANKLLAVLVPCAAKCPVSDVDVQTDLILIASCFIRKEFELLSVTGIFRRVLLDLDHQKVAAPAPCPGGDAQ